MSLRENNRLARLAAVQACYERTFEESLNHRGLKAWITTNQNIDIRNKFCQDLCLGYINYENELESILLATIERDRIEKLLGIIICLAIFELKHTDLPIGIIINEYLEIVWSFYDKSQVNFVNGILQNVANKYRNKDDKKN